MGYRKEEKKSTLDGKNIHARKKTWKRTGERAFINLHQRRTDG